MATIHSPHRKRISFPLLTLLLGWMVAETALAQAPLAPALQPFCLKAVNCQRDITAFDLTHQVTLIATFGAEPSQRPAVLKGANSVAQSRGLKLKEKQVSFTDQQLSRPEVDPHYVFLYFPTFQSNLKFTHKSMKLTIKAARPIHEKSADEALQSCHEIKEALEMLPRC